MRGTSPPTVRPASGGARSRACGGRGERHGGGCIGQVWGTWRTGSCARGEACYEIFIAAARLRSGRGPIPTPCEYCSRSRGGSSASRRSAWGRSGRGDIEPVARVGCADHVVDSFVWGSHRGVKPRPIHVDKPHAYQPLRPVNPGYTRSLNGRFFAHPAVPGTLRCASLAESNDQPRDRRRRLWRVMGDRCGRVKRMSWILHGSASLCLTRPLGNSRSPTSPEVRRVPSLHGR
jgi:hypothetical protein